MALGARPWVQLLLQSACTSMCRHIYDWNIVNCDVKQQIQLNSIQLKWVAQTHIDLISLETIGMESYFWHGCQEIMFGIKWRKKTFELSNLSTGLRRWKLEMANICCLHVRKIKWYSKTTKINYWSIKYKLKGANFMMIFIWLGILPSVSTKRWPIAKKELGSPGLWYRFYTLRNEYMYYGQRCNTVRVISRRVFGCDRMLRVLQVDVGCRRRGARNVGARVALAVFLWCSVDMI